MILSKGVKRIFALEDYLGKNIFFGVYFYPNYMYNGEQHR
jgi:hypothetical protein